MSGRSIEYAPWGKKQNNAEKAWKIPKIVTLKDWKNLKYLFSAYWKTNGTGFIQRLKLLGNLILHYNGIVLNWLS